jgi:hypothetical protein
MSAALKIEELANEATRLHALVFAIDQMLGKLPVNDSPVMLPLFGLATVAEEKARALYAALDRLGELEERLAMLGWDDRA